MAEKLEMRLSGSSLDTFRESGRSTADAGWSRRIECGNPQCGRRWMSLLKDHRRPVLEGKWGCCSRCMTALVEIAIRREAAESGAEVDDGPYRNRMPLGLIMLSRGWITQSQLRDALELQREAATGRIGEWLVKACGVKQETVLRALGLQWGCPPLNLEGFDPEAMALVVPRQLLQALGCVPLKAVANRLLYLASDGRVDASAAFAIERMSGLKVQSGLLDSAEWAEARERVCASSVETTVEQVDSVEAMSRRMVPELVGMQPRASRMVRFHQFYWMRMWLETGAMSLSEGGIPTARGEVVDRLYTVTPQQ